MYWYGHQLGVLMGFVFITIGMLVIFFGFSMSICSSGMFLQDCFGKNLSRIKIFLLSIPLVVVASLFFIAVVNVGVFAFAR